MIVERFIISIQKAIVTGLKFTFIRFIFLLGYIVCVILCHLNNFFYLKNQLLGFGLWVIFCMIAAFMINKIMLHKIKNFKRLKNNKRAIYKN